MNVIPFKNASIEEEQCRMHRVNMLIGCALNNNSINEVHQFLDIDQHLSKLIELINNSGDIKEIDEAFLIIRKFLKKNPEIYQNLSDFFPVLLQLLDDFANNNKLLEHVLVLLLNFLTFNPDLFNQFDICLILSKFCSNNMISCKRIVTEIAIVALKLFNPTDIEIFIYYAEELLHYIEANPKFSAQLFKVMFYLSIHIGKQFFIDFYQRFTIRYHHIQIRSIRKPILNSFLKDDINLLFILTDQVLFFVEKINTNDNFGNSVCTNLILSLFSKILLNDQLIIFPDHPIILMLTRLLHLKPEDCLFDKLILIINQIFQKILNCQSSCSLNDLGFIYNSNFFRFCYDNFIIFSFNIKSAILHMSVFIAEIYGRDMINSQMFSNISDFLVNNLNNIDLCNFYNLILAILNKYETDQELIKEMFEQISDFYSYFQDIEEQLVDATILDNYISLYCTISSLFDNVEEDGL